MSCRRMTTCRVQADGSVQRMGVYAALTRLGACVDGPSDAREKMRILTGGSIAIMCPAHMRVSRVKLFLHPRPLRVCAPWRVSIVFQGGALVTAGHFPANLTSGGTMSQPRSRIRDGRAPGGRHHSIRRRLSRQAGQRRRPLWIRTPGPLYSPGLIRLVNQASASAPRPLVPRPGSHTATKRSEAAGPSPPP